MPAFSACAILTVAAERAPGEEGFKVRVASVRTLQMLGKTTQRGRIQGKRRDWKKAIVRLMPGERIEFFEGA